jgi:hypothetical protein
MGTPGETISAGASDPYEAFCAARGLRWPAGLSRRLNQIARGELKDLVYWPGGSPDASNSLDYGLALLEEAVDRPPDNLLPIVPLDDRSIACAVCVAQEDWDPDGQEPGPAPCEVVRWHLGVIPEEEQGALIDDDAGDFVESLAAELRERRVTIQRVMDASRRYYSEFVEKDRVPRSHVLRPVQLACQNVIIGLATLRQDAAFDGLRVEDYATCEAPHLAAHEASRALIALLLCDAFRNGGTMEVRFGEARRERPVPPGLHRFGRARGLSVGSEDECAITPAEARRLFLAVTPMPDDLAERCATLFDRGVIAPERVCYTLMSGTWTSIELDYLAATSGRLKSILSGGSDIADRGARLAELEACRAALITGTLWRRVASHDGATGSAEGVRVFEDAAKRIDWRILETEGAVSLGGVAGPVPWWTGPGSPPIIGTDEWLIAVPRGLPTPADVALVRELADGIPQARVALLCPSDVAELLPSDLPCLACPDGLAELDAQAQARLHAMRVGRA